VSDGMSSADVLDRAVFEQMRAAVGEDDEFFCELIETYLSDSELQLASMRMAFAERDAAGLARAAHSLKSNSAGFGAIPLATLCAELEAAARGGTVAPVGAEITRLESEYRRVERVLQHTLQIERQKEAPTR
jgi:HPt (histidine-containing phosphotransfer) domain-containing protein